MSKEDAAPWSHFWQQGHITTFGAGFSENYEGSIAQFWWDIFAPLPDNSHLLDIATGNGAIAVLAANVATSHNKHFSISASDIAHIHTATTPGFSGHNTIQFYSETPAHKQPFAAASFDIISSQFGFEYGDTRATLLEILRLLKNRGSFHAICHHEASAIVRQAEADIVVYHHALVELTLFDKLQKLLQARAQGSKNYRGLSNDFNERVNAFLGNHGKHDSAKEIIQAISHLAKSSSAQNTQQQVQAINSAATEFSFAMQRLQQLQAAAMDINELNDLIADAKKLGFSECRHEEFLDPAGRAVGWRVHLTK